MTSQLERYRKDFAAALAPHYPSQEVNALLRRVLREVGGLPDSVIYSDKDTAFSEKQAALLQEALERLVMGEPLQYVLGYAEFCGRDFRVRPPVLIPRPETEELVEWVTACEKTVGGPLLDVGCGSGCIAVSLALALPDMEVEAWDILPEALDLATENVTRLRARVKVRCQDLFQAIPRPKTYRAVVSNPPYVCRSESREMARHVLDHESPLALFVPDEDPLRYYRALAEFSRASLMPGGSLYVEINARFGEETVRLFREYGFAEVLLKKDLEGRDRMVKATVIC